MPRDLKECDGFDISYFVGRDIFGFASNETALVFEWQFWILEWDQRALYEWVTTLQEAKKIYIREHKKWNYSPWSSYRSKK